MEGPKPFAPSCPNLSSSALSHASRRAGLPVALSPPHSLFLCPGKPRQPRRRFPHLLSQPLALPGFSPSSPQTCNPSLRSRQDVAAPLPPSPSSGRRQAALRRAPPPPVPPRRAPRLAGSCSPGTTSPGVPRRPRGRAGPGRAAAPAALRPLPRPGRAVACPRGLGGFEYRGIFRVPPPTRKLFPILTS